MKLLLQTTLFFCMLPFFSSYRAWAQEFYKGDYHIKYGVPWHIKAVLTDKITCPTLNVYLWVATTPALPELTFQTEVRSKLSADVPSVIRLAKDEREGRPLLLLMAPVVDETHQKQITFKAEYEMISRARSLVSDKTALKDRKVVAALTQKEIDSYLRTETSIVQWRNPIFQNWLEKNSLRRKKSERELNYAYRLLRFMQTTMSYTSTPSSDVSSTGVCATNGGDCAGLGTVFVAALREAGIPSRLLYGCFAASSTVEDDQHHVITEFFDKEIGWIPVSPSYAVAKKSLKVEDVIGFDDRFIAMSIGEDFVIPNSVSRWNEIAFQGLVWFFGEQKGHQAKRNMGVMEWKVDRTSEYRWVH